MRTKTKTDATRKHPTLTFQLDAEAAKLMELLPPGTNKSYVMRRAFQIGFRPALEEIIRQLDELGKTLRNSVVS